MRRLSMMPALIGVLVALGAGCGGGSTAGREEESVTPAEAVREIETIKTKLDEAVGQYRAGDADAADTTVGDAYLEHFELVEHPLEERDEELMEELERRIATQIRDEMKDGAPVTRIEALVADTKGDLDRAADLLER